MWRLPQLGRRPGAAGAPGSSLRRPGRPGTRPPRARTPGSPPTAGREPRAPVRSHRPHRARAPRCASPTRWAPARPRPPCPLPARGACRSRRQPSRAAAQVPSASGSGAGCPAAGWGGAEARPLSSPRRPQGAGAAQARGCLCAGSECCLPRGGFALAGGPPACDPRDDGSGPSVPTAPPAAAEALLCPPLAPPRLPARQAAAPSYRRSPAQAALRPPVLPAGVIRRPLLLTLRPPRLGGSAPRQVPPPKLLPVCCQCPHPTPRAPI